MLRVPSSQRSTPIEAALIKRYLQIVRRAARLLAILARAPMDAGMAQTAAPAEKRPSWGRSSSHRRSASRYVEPSPGTQRSRAPARVAGRPRPQTAVAVPAPTDGRRVPTPLNTNVVAEVGSPARPHGPRDPGDRRGHRSADDQEPGYRTTTGGGQGRGRRDGGDAPGEPADLFDARASPTARSTCSTTASRSARRT